DQFSPNFNLHSSFTRMSISFSVDAGFTLGAALKIGDIDISLASISFAAGITLGGDIIWKLDDPDTDTLSQGLETPFASRNLEQQVMRPDELQSEVQNCGSIWEKSGDLSFGLNFFLQIKVLGIPIVNKTFDIATFKIADFTSPPCVAPPPLAHLGD